MVLQPRRHRSESSAEPNKLFASRTPTPGRRSCVPPSRVSVDRVVANFGEDEFTLSTPRWFVRGEFGPTEVVRFDRGEFGSTEVVRFDRGEFGSTEVVSSDADLKRRGGG
ncbi:unnamed protein product [Arabis nemorensis]|uniref:Uncharacterized protein n=1 Tax=Arabis nemorensis TaxID=586526 RepID=A0A565BGX6_9BRAS|nr:unnamed protein product [Arabis nemorensis]